MNKCIICKKDIKEDKPFIKIGKDKTGTELFRHEKCYPGLPKFMKAK